MRAKDVLIEFDKPAASELMQEADTAAQQIDLDFLWECAPADEFAYTALAAEYFGASYGPVERAALVLRLHGSPVYFRRKGAASTSARRKSSSRWRSRRSSASASRRSSRCSMKRN